ncbi:MAG: hypothetical protein SFV19_16190 [Rhodospirillaceae bacterium]|nr:hypothetical protein [Rhodospirillaceae bacterium]
MARSRTFKALQVAGMCILFALMLFHAALAPVMFKELSGRLVWYVSTDLSVVFLIFLNLAVAYGAAESRTPWRLCHTANGLGVALGILNLAAVPEPINIPVLIGFLALAIGTFGRDRGTGNASLLWVRGDPKK